jgi:hypothetical protein
VPIIFLIVMKLLTFVADFPASIPVQRSLKSGHPEGDEAQHRRQGGVRRRGRRQAHLSRLGKYLRGTIWVEES